MNVYVLEDRASGARKHISEHVALYEAQIALEEQGDIRTLDEVRAMFERGEAVTTIHGETFYMERHDG